MTQDFIPTRLSHSIEFNTLGNGDVVVLNGLHFGKQPVLSLGVQYDKGVFNAAQLNRTQVAGLIQTLQSWMLNNKLPENPQALKAPVSETNTNVQQA